MWFFATRHHVYSTGYDSACRPPVGLLGAAAEGGARSAGVGQIDHRHLDKLLPEVGMLVVKIGGPAYRIGMGGGAASSVPSGSREGAQAADLDFNAVQVLPS